MARKLKAFPDLERRTYPWDEWFDGSVWEIGPDDYTPPASSFQMTVRQAAIRHGGRAKCRRKGEVVYLQYEATDGAS